MKILSFRLLVVGLLLYCISYAVIPTITGFNPGSGLPGAPVVISGNGFDGVTATNNVVYFGDHLATVNSATATSLSVTVPLGASSSKITVINTNTKLQTTSNLLFTPVFPNDGIFNNYSFQELPNINLVSGIAYDMETIDLNNDTYPDIAMADYNSPLIVSQNVSNPSGIAFANLISYTNLSTDPDISIAKGDLDGDGKYDIIIGNNNNTISIFNNTSGNSIDISTFASPFTLSGVNSVRDIAIADLNIDGKPDIICTNSSGDVVIFQNNYAGGVLSLASFGSPVVLTGTFDRLVTSDFNNDGQPDMIAVGQSTSQITFFQNKLFGATIDFSKFTITSIASPGNCFSLDCGDLDGDDKIDLAVTDNINSGAVYIYKNISTGTSITFDSPLSITPFYNAKEVSIADLDGDTRPDIAIACTDGSSCTNFIIKNSTISNTITGSSFSNIASLDNNNNNGYIYGQKIADFDNDGKSDIGMVTYNNSANTYNISIYKNTFGFTPTILGVLPLLPRQGDAVSIIGQYFDNSISDFEIGGTRVTYTIVNPSLILANVPYNIPNGDIYMENTKGTQSFPNELYLTPSITDFTLTATPGDIITIYGENFAVDPNGRNGSNTIYFGPVSAGVISASNTLMYVKVPQNAGYGQLQYTNNITRRSTSSPGYFIPNYPGTNSISEAFFASVIQLTTTGIPYYIDLNAGTYNASQPDLIATYYFNPAYFKAGIFRNNTLVDTIKSSSFDEFSLQSDISGVTNYYPGKPKYADVDGNSDPDQFILQNGNLYYSLYHNSYGYNNYSNMLFSNVSSFDLGDMNKDGWSDIITFDSSIPVINIYGNMNGGGFNLIASITGMGYFNDLRIADIDSDGFNDIIAFNSSGVSVFRNNCGNSLSGSCFMAPYLIPRSNYGGGIEIADLNNDQKPDIIFNWLNSSTSFPGINLYANASLPGTITFDTTGINLSSYIQGSSSTPVSDISVGDLNGDKKPDLVCITNKNSNGWVTIFQNNSATGGPLSIVTPPTLITFAGAGFTSLNVNDLDGDWKPEIIISNNNTLPGVIILQNTSPGKSFAPVTAIVVSAGGTGLLLTAPGGNLPLNISFLPDSASDKTWSYYIMNSPSSDTSSFIDPMGNFYGRTNGVYTISIYPTSYHASGNQVIQITVTGQNLAITDFSPSVSAPGSILNIKGSYFNTNPGSNFVLIGGVKAQVLSSDLYNLQVIVPDGARFGLISVTNTEIESSAISAAPFTPTFNGSGDINANSFVSTLSINFSKAKAIASADLDGDGLTDFVVLNDNSYTIYRNTISAVNNFMLGFDQEHMTLPYGNPLCIHIQDINKDGKPDILIGGDNSEIFINYNHTNPGDITVNDFDGMDNQDLSLSFGLPVSISTLDLDDDGYIDILVIDDAGNLSTYSSNPDAGAPLKLIQNGFRSLGDDVFIGFQPSGIELSDLDNDGNEEVLISRSGISTLYVAPKELFISSGQGKKQGCPTCKSQLPEPSYIQLKYASNFIKIVDIDGDTYPDMLSLNDSSASLTVLRNFSGTEDSISFREAAIITFTGVPSNLDIGDINGDGLPDIAVTDTSGYIHLIQNKSTVGNISISTLPKTTIAAPSRPAFPLLVDLNMDHRPDLTVTDPTTNRITIYLNTTPFSSSSFPVDSIIVISEDSASLLSLNRIKLQMRAIVLPFGADTSVTWTLMHNNSSDYDLTTISSVTGLLELNSTTVNGIVTVVGTSLSNPMVSGYFVVTFVGKSITPAISIASNENLTIAGFVASPCYSTYELSVPSVTGQSYQWYYNDLNDTYGKNGLRLVGAIGNIYNPVVNGHYYVIALDTIAYVYTSYPVTISGFKNASIATAAGQNMKTSLIIINSDSITADSYQWYVDNIPIKTATSKSLDVYYNGRYYLITKSNSDGCKLKSNEIQIGNENLRSIQDSGLIKDSTVENYGPDIQPFDVKIYPNPASGVFTIEVKSQDDINNYEIADITGRVMESGEMLKSGNKFSNAANNRNLDKGIYFVTIRNHSQKKCIKVVVE